MEFTKNIEALEPSSLRLTIVIDKNEVDQVHKELLKDYSKKLMVKGFRKGHVPESVIGKKLGNDLLQEVASSLMDRSAKEVFESLDEEQKPLPYSQPELENRPELKLGEEFIFSLRYDIFPKVELGPYKNLEVSQQAIEVTDEDIESELKRIQEQSALVVDKKDEIVTQDSIVTINYHEVDDSEKAIPSTKREDFTFTVGSLHNIYQLDDLIIGMKKGESKILEKTFDKNYVFPEIAGKTKKIFVKIGAVKIKDLPEINDELAKDVSEKFTTLQDLKDHIRESLTKEATQHVENKMSAHLIEAIAATSKINLPASMIQYALSQRWQEYVYRFQGDKAFRDFIESQGKTPKDMLDEWQPEIEKELMATLIVRDLLEKEKIEISEEEVEEELIQRAKDSDMALEKYKEKVAAQNFLDYLKDEIRRKKLFVQLASFSNVKKSKKVSLTEFQSAN